MALFYCTAPSGVGGLFSPSCAWLCPSLLLAGAPKRVCPLGSPVSSSSSLGVFGGFWNNAFRSERASDAVGAVASSALALPPLKAAAAAAGINRIQLFVGVCRAVFGERAPAVARTHGSPVPLCPHREAAAAAAAAASPAMSSGAAPLRTFVARTDPLTPSSTQPCLLEAFVPYKTALVAS